MKFIKLISFFLIASLILASCCLGNPDCKSDYFAGRFRILDDQTNQDLLFGPTKVYDPNDIKLYSLQGSDTIPHLVRAGIIPGTPATDSVLLADFDYRKFLTVYLRLNNTDTDTITLEYKTIDGSPCCPGHTEIASFTNNGTPLLTTNDGITFLKK